MVESNSNCSPKFRLYILGIILKRFFWLLMFKVISPQKTIFVNSYLHIKLCILSRNMCKAKSNLHKKMCTLSGISCNLHIIMCKINLYYFILTSDWAVLFSKPRKHINLPPPPLFPPSASPEGTFFLFSCI